MESECFMVFARTKIICHGARAYRIGERLLRKVWNYLSDSDFVKGDIQKCERLEIFHSIKLEPVITYPDDIEKMDTDCDIIFQIIFNDNIKVESLNQVCEKYKDIPSIVFVIGNEELKIEDLPYINVAENEILETFLDIFSVYTFPQEYGADFEELRPIFEHKGKILRKKGERFNLCAIRKAKRTDNFDREIQSLEREKGSYVLVSRIGNEPKIIIYSI